MHHFENSDMQIDAIRKKRLTLLATQFSLTRRAIGLPKCITSLKRA
jgi:hypothetical protein